MKILLRLIAVIIVATYVPGFLDPSVIKFSSITEQAAEQMAKIQGE